MPGSAEANYDAFEANPNETTKQRQEREVHQLLEKLQPDMIALDANLIGNIDVAPEALRAVEKAESLVEKDAATEMKEVNRMRGRNKSSKRWKRNKDSQLQSKQLKQQAEQASRELLRADVDGDSNSAHNEDERRSHKPRSALDRFL